jgi:NTP pyrophosphatase (non-canonical NTP hydrolase)
MDIKAISQEIHENAKAKGFFEEGDKKNIGEMLMLIVTEVSEAMEADRIGEYYDAETRYRINKDLSVNGAKWAFDIVDSNQEAWNNWFVCEVKNSFGDELADVVIRVMDMCAFKGIDLEWHIIQKIRYNKTRPHKHGGKKC